jgi:hypothetical protein
MREIHKGDLITIKSIHHTKDVHGLDEDGVMKSMVGGTFKVNRSSNKRIYIKSEQHTDTEYVWRIEDILPVDEKEPEPNIFKFDENQLIV